MAGCGVFRKWTPFSVTLNGTASVTAVTGKIDDFPYSKIDDFPYSNQALDLLNSLEESIGKIDDFLSFERGYVHGDIVYSASDPSGQTGRVVHVDMSVNLESTDGKVIRDVSSLKISRIRSIYAGDYVVHQHWLGRVDRVIDSVDIVFDDGTRCSVITLDQDRIEPISSKPVDDPQLPYYPGQRVRVKLPTVSRHTRWLCGTWKASHDEGIVCAVKADLVQVEWLGSFLCRDDTNLSMPPNLVNTENVTALSCFSHSNWQLGDWCSVTTGGNLLTHVKSGNGFQRKDSTSNPESIFVVSRTRTAVDVVWQDGTRSMGVDSQSLLPVNIADVHEFWPEQFVLIKNSTEDPPSSETQKWGVVRSMDSKEKTVKVAWKNHSSGEANDLGEEIVSAYELIDHPDYSFCLKDIVFRLARDEPEPDFEGKKGSLENTYLPLIGNVVGLRDGAVEVKWATGFTTMVAPYEIFRSNKLEVPSPALVTREDNILSQQITNHEMQHSDPKGTDLLSYCTVSYEEYRKNYWERIPLSLSRSAVGFLTGLTANLFGSTGSASDFGSGPSDPVPGDESSWEDQLEDCVGTHHTGMEMKTSESEVKNSSNSLLGIEENKFALSLEKPGDEKFKQFDLVNDCSDHHFLDQASNEQSQYQRSWLKKVQHEWSVLEKNLPDTIYVRAYEERMDLLRAAIVGAPGTPYHDGLFLFDIFLPPEFPNVPPYVDRTLKYMQKVHYHSGGLRLNPNLYESGKVCLSLLNTWNGTGSEVWDPQSSTVLQVLVSLQALVLNDRPYFNEAGYDTQVGKAEGEKNSVSYNENAFLLTCKSMMYLLRRSPKHFEALILEHFGNCYQYILRACKHYTGGALVGFSSGHRIEGEEETHKDSSTGFKIMLSKLYPKLIEAFEEKGFDCSHFTCP